MIFRLQKLLFFFIFLLMPLLVFATSQKTQTNLNNAVSNQGDSGQVQSQAKTQIQSSNPSTGVMTQTHAEEKLNIQIQESKPQYSPRSAVAREHMSAVATAVESLVRFAARIETKGIGDQIREIARLQGESEDRVNQSLDKAQQRTKWTKFFIGPNFNGLGEMRKEIERNRLRIQELQKLVFKLQNKGERTALQNQLEILESQNISLQNALKAEERGFSFLGWLFKWIAKY